MTRNLTLRKDEARIHKVDFFDGDKVSMRMTLHKCWSHRHVMCMPLLCLYCAPCHIFILWHERFCLYHKTYYQTTLMRVFPDSSTKGSPSFPLVKACHYCTSSLFSSELLHGSGPSCGRVFSI